MKSILRWLRDVIEAMLAEQPEVPSGPEVRSVPEHPQTHQKWTPAPDWNNRDEPKPDPYIRDEDFMRLLANSKTQAAMEKGQVAFRELLTFWVQGFGDEDAEQPDRAAYLEYISARSLNMLVYIYHRGFLIQAVYDEGIFPEGTKDPKDAAVHIAANIAQVASLKHPDLSDLYHPVIPWET